MTCKYSNKCTTYHHYREHCPEDARKCPVAREYRTELSRKLDELDEIQKIFERGMR